MCPAGSSTTTPACWCASKTGHAARCGSPAPQPEPSTVWPFGSSVTREGLEWHQEDPNTLRHRNAGGFEHLMTRRIDGTLSPEAEHASRLVIGHPEGLFEAFANLYTDAADAIAARRTGTPVDPLSMDFPTVLDGARGMKFIVASVESSRTGRWESCRLDI